MLFFDQVVRDGKSGFTFEKRPLVAELKLKTLKINTSCSVIAKIISGVPDKMSGRHSVPCRTF